MEHKLRGLTSMSRGQRILMLSLNKQLHNITIPAISVTLPPVANEKRRPVCKRARLERRVNATGRGDGEDCWPIPCAGGEPHSGDPVDQTAVPPVGNETQRTGCKRARLEHHINATDRGDGEDCQPIP